MTHDDVKKLSPGDRLCLTSHAGREYFGIVGNVHGEYTTINWTGLFGVDTIYDTSPVWYSITHRRK